MPKFRKNRCVPKKGLVAKRDRRKKDEKREKKKPGTASSQAGAAKGAGPMEPKG